VGGMIGEMLPFAVGIAASPVPVIVVVLMLLGARPRATSLGFALGWLVGLSCAFGIIVALVELLPKPSGDEPSLWVGPLQLALGLLLLCLAATQWNKRHCSKDEPHLPPWMSRISEMGFARSLRFGITVAAANPKHIAFLAGASVSVGAPAMPVTTVLTVIAMFSVIAASTVWLPTLLFLVAAERLSAPLRVLGDWLTRENHTIMAVLFLLLGASAIGDGIGAMWA
jgi:threonine/homoserine/homoserine lactone efflux protein